MTRSTVSASRNRRRNLRASVELPVAWRDVRGGEPTVTTVFDVSASGMAMRGERRLSSGRLLYVVVGHEELGLRFEAVAKVLRSEPTEDGFALFLSFDTIVPEAAAAIARFVVRELARTRPDGSADEAAEQPRPRRRIGHARKDAAA